MKGKEGDKLIKKDFQIEDDSNYDVVRTDVAGKISQVLVRIAFVLGS